MAATVKVYEREIDPELIADARRRAEEKIALDISRRMIGACMRVLKRDGRSGPESAYLFHAALQYLGIALLDPAFDDATKEQEARRMRMLIDVSRSMFNADGELVIKDL